MSGDNAFIGLYGIIVKAPSSRNRPVRLNRLGIAKVDALKQLSALWGEVGRVLEILCGVIAQEQMEKKQKDIDDKDEDGENEEGDYYQPSEEEEITNEVGIHCTTVENDQGGNDGGDEYGDEWTGFGSP